MSGVQVLPGDVATVTSFINRSIDEDFTENEQETARVIKLGHGLIKCNEGFNSLFAGTLSSIPKTTKFNLQFNQKKVALLLAYLQYAPVVGQSVIGVVIGKSAEAYKVDIGYYVPAFLNNLSFEGASKKNRPMLEVFLGFYIIFWQIGSLVYARLHTVSRDIESELTCACGGNKNNGFGLLEGGYLVKISNLFAKCLLTSSFLTDYFAKQNLVFDMAVGLNNLLWLKGSCLKETHLLVLILEAVKEMKAELFAEAAKFNEFVIPVIQQIIAANK